MDSMCENGYYVIKNNSHQIAHQFFCHKTESMCSYIRWCVNEGKLKMNSKYLECRGRDRVDSKVFETNKNISETETSVVNEKMYKTTDDIEQKNKIEVCDVLFYDGKTVNVNFQGFGISIPYDKKVTNKTIKVKYSGTIGTKDFMYKIAE